MRADTVDRMIDAFFGDDRSYGIGELDDYRRRMDDALTVALSSPQEAGAEGSAIGLTKKLEKTEARLEEAKAVLMHVAGGSIDVSGTAIIIIIGYPGAIETKTAARAFLHQGGEGTL